MSFQIFKIPVKILHWIRIGFAARRVKKSTAADRIHAQKALAKLLGDVRGATMKVGQLMAGNEDNTPFQSLVTSITPLSLARILPVLEMAIEQPKEKVFKVFDESQAAASLGQVHYAVLHDGTRVAVKVRYPGIAEAVNAELKLVDWMPSAGPFKRWGFDTADYKNTLRRQLLREIDYSIEAHTQHRFKQNINVSGLHIPDIYHELCYESVLTQSWESGCRFNEVCSWSKKDRLEIGRTLLMTLFQSLFVQGEIHGDPHPGNYLFRHDPQGKPVTVLLDYGCTVLISKPRRLALLKLLDAYHQGTVIDAMQCFSMMGFNRDKLEHINNKLPELCEILFQPFIVQRPFDTSQWQLSQKLNDLLEQQRWWFRSAGPADLILLLRAFHGLNQQLIELNIALPWWPLLKYVVGDQLLEQARSLKTSDTIDKPITSHKLKVTARKLCILITNNETPSMSLELPAEAALELDTMIPATVLSEIQSITDFNLTKFLHRLHHEGITPQLVFESNKAEKTYKVWLE